MNLYFFFKITFNLINLIILVVTIFLARLFEVILMLISSLKLKRNVTRVKNIKLINYKARKIKKKSLNLLMIDLKLLHLNNLLKLVNFKQRKVSAVRKVSNFMIEDAISTCFEHFYKDITFCDVRKFWRYQYYRFYNSNTFPIDLKPYINKPAGKTWYTEAYRDGEYKFVADDNFLIFTLENFWEFDYGCAEYSWNIVTWTRYKNIVKEYLLTDEEQQQELTDPLMLENSEENLFYSRPIIRPEEF